MQDIRHYDIIVIGSGPAGEKSATQASKLKKQVALIEKLPRLGGASLHTGTIPSKSLRETVFTCRCCASKLTELTLHLKKI